MSSTRVIILDCGASRTALGVFTRKGSRLVLENYAVEIFPAGATGEDQWLDATTAAMQTLRRQLKRVDAPVVLVLPAHLALTKLIKTPRVEPAKREKIIRFEAEQNIPYALAEVVWGSVLVGERAIDLEIMLAAAKLEAVEPLCAAAQAAGMAPRAVLPASLATLAGFRLAPSRDTGSVLLLNLGARSTNLLLVEANRFAARTLAIGGQGITQQLAANQACDFEEAERIKLSDHGAHLAADAMDGLATRLAQEVTRSVLHFNRTSDLAHPRRIIVTGGGARLAGLDAVLAEKLKVPVERLDLLGSIEIGHQAAQNDVAEHALALTDLIGAAATQLRPGQLTLNLLPPIRRSHETQRQRQPWLIAAAALVLVALAPPVWHVHAVAAAATEKTAAIEAELGPLRMREARNRANLRQLEALTRELNQLQGVSARRASWAQFLADFQDRLVAVEDVWLEQLRVMPATEEGGPLRLVVTGRMLDRTNPLSKVSPETSLRVQALLARFVDSPFVASVESERFDSSQPGILKFDCVLVADPARPL